MILTVYCDSSFRSYSFLQCCTEQDGVKDKCTTLPLKPWFDSSISGQLHSSFVVSIFIHLSNSNLFLPNTEQMVLTKWAISSEKIRNKQLINKIIDWYMLFACKPCRDLFYCIFYSLGNSISGPGFAVSLGYRKGLLVKHNNAYTEQSHSLCYKLQLNEYSM